MLDYVRLNRKIRILKTIKLIEVNVPRHVVIEAVRTAAVLMRCEIIHR